MAAENPASQLWTEVDKYFGDLLAPADEHLDAATQSQSQGRPSRHRRVSAAGQVSSRSGPHTSRQSACLRSALLGGYSTIWMARALPRGGRIVSLEFSPKHAEVARQNLKRSGLLSRVDIRVGPALETLPTLKSEGPFDLIFIDADKVNNAAYLDWAIKLAHRGSIVIVDNITRHGHVIDAKTGGPDVQGTRKCLKQMGTDPRLSAFAMQTVGAKGHDGFAMAVVL